MQREPPRSSIAFYPDRLKGIAVGWYLSLRLLAQQCMDAWFWQNEVTGEEREIEKKWWREAGYDKGERQREMRGMSVMGRERVEIENIMRK